MLPKVETEAPGLVRSHGEQGQMPENMQGKGVRCGVARRSGSWFYTLGLTPRASAFCSMGTRAAQLAVVVRGGFGLLFRRKHKS